MSNEVHDRVSLVSVNHRSLKNPWHTELSAPGESAAMEHRLGGHTKVQRKYPETQHRGFLHCHWHGKLHTHPLAASSISEIISTAVRCNSEFRGSSDAVTGEVTAWQPNCMRCDRGCKAIVPETSSCGSVSVSSDVSDVVPRGRVSAHGVTEPMKSGGVTQPKVGGTKG